MILRRAEPHARVVVPDHKRIRPGTFARFFTRLASPLSNSKSSFERGFSPLLQSEFLPVVLGKSDLIDKLGG